MQEYFEREILSLERELTNLKTSMMKSAGVIETRLRSVNVSIPLEVYGSVARGQARVRVTTDGDGMIFPTLEKYYDDIMKSMEQYESRYRTLQLIESDDQFYIIIRAWGTFDDVIAISGGGSVRVDCALTVQCTCDFEMEVVS